MEKGGENAAVTAILGFSLGDGGVGFEDGYADRSGRAHGW